MVYLVDVVLFSQLVKEAVHAVQHRHDFHRSYPAADLCERHDVAEQNCHAIKVLEKNTRTFYTRKNIVKS